MFNYSNDNKLQLIAICNYFAILPKEFSLINVEQSWNLT